MRVLAVVVTHDRRELLKRCVGALKSQAGVSPDVLVIDNASSDGTVEMLQACGVDFLTQENVGSAGGWHRGIEAALERGCVAPHSVPDLLAWCRAPLAEWPLVLPEGAINPADRLLIDRVSVFHRRCDCTISIANWYQLIAKNDTTSIVIM